MTHLVFYVDINLNLSIKHNFVIKTNSVTKGGKSCSANSFFYSFIYYNFT